MWIFTSKGFISVVQHRQYPEKRLVRARERDVLKELFPGEEIVKLNDADYRYRVTVPAKEVAMLLFDSIMKMDYDNFKNSISPKKEAYHDACMKVWSVMQQM